MTPPPEIPAAPRRFRNHLWIVRALAVAAAVPAAVIATAASGTVGADAFLGDLLLLLLAGVAVVIALTVAVVMALKRRWRRAIGAAMMPLSLAIALLCFAELDAAGTTAGEYLHFRLMRATYLAEIAAMPAAAEPRLAVFELSSDGWFAHTNYHLAVYDESDEVALPDAQRSPEWQARGRDTPLESGVGYVASMGGHFYIVRISE
jgi:hypothetical protein